MPRTIVILGTGGTIAGTAASPLDNVGYTAAQRPVAQLLSALALWDSTAAAEVEAEQVVQFDSKDMDHSTWAMLARRAASHLARPEVAGLVVTHGTDTLEETAWLLQRVLAPTKPVVLTAAMRPATALQADGPQNLLDALAVARTPGALGVLVVVAGQVHGAAQVRKWHPYRLDAFTSGDAGPLAVVEEGRLRRFKPWPDGTPLGLALLPDGAAGPDAQAGHEGAAAWPWVEVVSSHAGARPHAVRALCAAGVQGLVVATTGNGTVHQALQAALDEAAAAGVLVWHCTRCAGGALVGAAVGPASALSPWQARVELLLHLLARQRGATPR